jgi:ABC-type uncharacterized transport system substrate-binding protein
MNRRDFITLLGGATLVMPGSVGAQQPARMRRIGVLMAYAENDREYRAHLAAFREELQKLGWTEGRNYQTDYRWAELDPEVMRRFAKELIALQPDVILSSSSPTTASLLQETNSIPVIFANIVDPVGSGLAASLSRPGGNATGSARFPSHARFCRTCSIRFRRERISCRSAHISSAALAKRPSATSSVVSSECGDADPDTTTRAG